MLKGPYSCALRSSEFASLSASFCCVLAVGSRPHLPLSHGSTRNHAANYSKLQIGLPVKMVLVRAFRALRPRPDLAHALVSVPYDVVSRDEAAALAASSPHSFLHVTKPEIDLPADADPYGADVYLRGRENLERMVDDGVLVRDPHESYYVYRLEMGGRAQTGVVVAVRCAEYDAGIVRRHELTRPDKEDDRVAHIKTHRRRPVLPSWFTGAPMRSRP